ncbi:hypothetical protein PFLUV_G00060310 [Perca fluviatilis]|uniref:Podoplanin n=1 Tax=Perca fluviatilis TaxID=8168 RepID=A0A6A5FFM6_PERFL|nr:podoplanin isoform X2 [Perca fluviatilis]KAF1390659.1 hypothetical protein PFLUV_G00060310 [Perca fluviatilis]
MNVQLLLLLALVGPFCAFTHASPTEIPSHPDDEITEIVADIIPEATEAPKEDLTVITGPPATEPAAAPEEVATEVPEEVATEEVATEVVTEAALPAFTVNTEEAVVETEAPSVAATVAAPEPLITDAPVVETEAPDESTDVEVQPEVTEAAKTGEDVVLEDTVDGLSSGQVVGIVIGALLAVVILIAVVIAVVRRMGKYSP